ncbi:hypothetical protein BUALT_Bualt02G0047000 [Buddleja alternifolia]|uniref:TF-B3 domain-containing protein n=1 Tax=Buddleja alternifolia TaxID=168488 RepID=A0AAV6Y8D0_9LAMI|nr:hypothetical protein BUALT_Bualt02G0047000 [Buddleja alternifolia]
MRALANDAVILRDRYTNTWQVAVSRVGHDWYFDKGWAKFYKENSLEWGDFLVFEYKGNNLFDFKLLGETACEKKGGATTTKSRRKQNIAPHCYGDEIFESGLVPRPKNPFFVSRSRKEKRRNELLIPKNVIEDYNLNLREIMFLVDRKGNKWETKIKRWRDGRVCLNRGWRGLCTMNDIKRDDVCVCEFVQRNDNEGRDILVYAVDSLDK